MYRFFPLFPLLIALISCSEDSMDVPFRPECGAPIQLVDAYDAVHEDSFLLQTIAVSDRCLAVTVAASGCTDQHFEMVLLTHGSIVESSPTRATAQLIFNRGEAGECEGLLEKTFAFDLSPYLSENELPSQLMLIGLDTTLLIE